MSGCVKGTMVPPALHRLCPSGNPRGAGREGDRVKKVKFSFPYFVFVFWGVVVPWFPVQKLLLSFL